MAQPGWLNAFEGQEEWPRSQQDVSAAARLDFGAFPAHDFDAVESSEGSPRDKVDTFVKRATLEQDGTGPVAAARNPLAAIATDSRSMLGPLKLQSLFEPLSQSQTSDQPGKPIPFTFECGPTAIRMPTQRNQSASPLAAHDQRSPKDAQLISFEGESQGSVAEPAEGSLVQEVQNEAYEERSGSLGKRSPSSIHSSPTAPAKRQRLQERDDDTEQYDLQDERDDLPLPPSAVRMRIQAKRLARRSSLPPSFPTFDIPSVRSAPQRSSLPLTFGRDITPLAALDRSARRESIMENARREEHIFTPIRGPTRPNVAVATISRAPTLEAVIEDEYERSQSERFGTPSSPYARPMPPTPMHGQPIRPMFSSFGSSAARHAPLTPSKPRDPALAASAVDELFPPSPEFPSDILRAAAIALPESADSSPEAPLHPRSVLKRPGSRLPSGSDGDARSPRSVSFTEQLFAAKAAGSVLARGHSALRHEIEMPDATSSNDPTVVISPQPPAQSTGRGLDLSQLSQALRDLGGSNPAQTSQAYMSSVGSAASIFSGVPKSGRTSRAGNATFLTECSFGVAREDLIRFVTDIEPYEPHWGELRFIDLSNKHIESVARLKDFLPRLDEVVLSDNLLTYLTGLPAALRGLAVARNQLTDLTSFQALAHLERLDLSGNQLESLRQLSALKHLRHLKAENNALTSIEGLEEVDTLVGLSLRNNQLKSFDASKSRWPQLERLDLAENSIAGFSMSVESCRSLIHLTLDCNMLASFSLPVDTPSLRILRLSHNPLIALDGSGMRGLRTLFLDETKVRSIMGLGKMRKLENLSLRSTKARANYAFGQAGLRETRRLYLSGQTIDWRAFGQPCLNLVYVELAMCHLTSLPAELAQCLPNCRTLVLDNNAISSLAGLSHMQRLRRLSATGCRISRCRAVLAVLATLPELEILDLRGNPCAARFYLPAPLSSLPKHADHAMHGLVQEDKPPMDHEPASAAAWREADAAFLKSLPNLVYIQRAMWRSLAVQEAPKLRFLDGLSTAQEANGGQNVLAQLRKEGAFEQLYEQLDVRM